MNESAMKTVLVLLALLLLAFVACTGYVLIAMKIEEASHDERPVQWAAGEDEVR